MEKFVRLLESASLVIKNGNSLNKKSNSVTSNAILVINAWDSCVKTVHSVLKDICWRLDISVLGNTRMSSAIGVIWTSLSTSSNAESLHVTSVLSIFADSASQGLPETEKTR